MAARRRKAPTRGFSPCPKDCKHRPLRHLAIGALARSMDTVSLLADS